MIPTPHTAGTTTRIVVMLRAFANPARLAILQYLDGTERSVAELEANLGVIQPHLSQHLADLRAVGAVAARRDGRSVFYRLRDESVQTLIRQIWRVAAKTAPDQAAAMQHHGDVSFSGKAAPAAEAMQP